MGPRLLIAACLLLVMMAPAAAVAQESDGAMLLIMDASGSMNADDADGQPLIDGAKLALHDVIESLPDGTHVGLRVYGHRFPNTDEERGCTDTELIHPVQPLDRSALTDAVDGFEAQGFTPIALSLEEAASDLPPEGARTIVLVSDGEETCADADAACDVAADLRDDGIDLVIETVGFALGDNDEARAQLECIAEAGGGAFHDVDTAAELTDELVTVSTREARRFEAEGIPVEGGTSPGNAPLIEPGSYADTIQTGETLFYRFDVSPGAALSATAIRGRVTDDEHGGVATFFYLDVVDRFGDEVAGDCCSGEQAREIHIRGVADIEAPEDVDELYLQVDIEAWSSDRPAGEFPLQVELEIEEGTAESESPTPTEADSATETDVPTETDTPADDADDETVGSADMAGAAAAPGLPGWAAALLVVLTLAVLGLGVAVAMLVRRTSRSPT